MPLQTSWLDLVADAEWEPVSSIKKLLVCSPETERLVINQNMCYTWVWQEENGTVLRRNVK